MEAGTMDLIDGLLEEVSHPPSALRLDTTHANSNNSQDDRH